MQDCPLTVTGLFEHGEALHSRVLVRVFDGHQVKGVPYGQVAGRVRRLGGALQAAGIRPGDRVGTLMWNTQPHLEAYFAAPCIGAVLHTVNPRLFPDQIGEILDDAEDSALLVDTSLWASTAPLLAARKSVQLVVLAGPGAAELAETSELPVPVVQYERFLPDRYVQADVLTELIASERPTVSGGVPTVWRGVLQHAESRNLDITSLRVVSCAGSAVPPALIRDYDRLGIELLQAWGMTETSPLAAVARAPAWAGWP